MILWRRITAYRLSWLKEQFRKKETTKIEWAVSMTKKTFALGWKLFKRKLCCCESSRKRHCQVIVEVWFNIIIDFHFVNSNLYIDRPTLNSYSETVMRKSDYIIFLSTFSDIIRDTYYSKVYRVSSEKYRALFMLARGQTIIHLGSNWIGTRMQFITWAEIIKDIMC